MSIHEECGVFGVYDPAGDCARTAYYGLYALQHRGQEACGIAAINDRELSFHKDLGLVGEITRVDVTLIRNSLENGTIPVVATIAAGENDGNTYNINACF